MRTKRSATGELTAPAAAGVVATPLRRRTEVRPEIQALRAVAVLAVVAHHAAPRLAPAGYVGVDVFFTVSGFLITGLLVREHARTGRIDFRAFYLRRIRRLLPAAVVALSAAALVTLLFVPEPAAQRYFGGIAASLLYVQNWRLAAGWLDPDRTALDASPLVHFWSLSVEEQFYLVWPVLIALALALAGARWWRGARETRVLATILVLVVLLSFAYCVVQSYMDAPIAYYSTLARAWEFGAGGLLALAAPLDRLRAAGRALLSWVGLALIVLPVLTWSDPAPFPGWIAAVPVFGTLAVIAAGTPKVRWGTTGLARLPPVQWVGDASYSLYLWHWPIIAFFPYVTGVPSPWYLVLLLVVVGFAVAGLSLRYLENPIRFRSARFLRHRRVIAVALTALGILTLGVSVWRSLVPA